MLKNFAHLAARLRYRFLIKLCPVLAILALPVASAFVVIPSSSAAQGECDCSHLKELQIELRNAVRLQQAFLNKVAELRAMGRNTSQVALQQFAQGEARQGIEPVPGYKGPSEFDYDSYGRSIYDREGTKKYSNEELCGMTPYATAQLLATIAASACPGIGWGIRAHEEVHINFCKRIGFLPYEDMHGADRAQEEAEAYGAQIKVLRDVIAKLRCGYRATGRIGDLKYNGVICSFEKPFTIQGEIQGYPMHYQFNFTPSSTNAGRMELSGAGHLVTAEGSATYSVEGLDTGHPRIMVSGSATGHSPVGSVTKASSGTLFDLVPLDTDECQGK